MTRRSPRLGALLEQRHGEIDRAEIDVREPRRTGAFMISAATASADSGPSITRQGMMIFWSPVADHSK